MKRMRYMILAVVALLAAGCEKVVEFEVGDQEQRVVVNSMVSADSTVSIKLSYSRFFLEGNYWNSTFPTIDNATVELLRNGNAETVALVGGGVYQSNCRPNPGDELKLKVMVPGKKTVESSCRVPVRADFEVVDFVVDTVSGYRGDVKCRLRLKMNDKGGERNYYRVEVKGWSTGWDEDLEMEVPSRMWMSLSSSDPVFNLDMDLEEVIGGGVENEVWGRALDFDDQMFEGGSHVLTINFEYYDYLWYENNRYVLNPMDYPLEIFVGSISEELYRYSQTREAAEGDDLLSFFAEPVQVYCNIKNGLGIFATKTTTKNKLVPRYAVLN